jgi:hypothetical protein
LLTRGQFTGTAPVVKDFLFLFLPVLRNRSFDQFTNAYAVVKNFLQLFFRRQKLGFTKNVTGRLS